MNTNISSPILKARKKQAQVRLAKCRFFIFLVISPCLFLLAIFRFLRGHRQSAQFLTVAQVTTYPGDAPLELPFWPPILPHAGTIYTRSSHSPIAHSSGPLDLLHLRMAEPIETKSLTALLPVTSRSLSNLEVIISSLIRTSGKLHEVILSCSDNILPDVRRIVRKVILAEGTEGHLEFSLRPWDYGMDSSTAIMRAASEVTTDWVLFLDDNGLNNVDVDTQDILINPMSIPLPTGPRGVASLLNISCLAPSDDLQPASFVIPPFVMPYSLVIGGLASSTEFGIWADLGERISRDRLDGIGGIVMGTDTTSNWCQFAQLDATLWNHTASVLNLWTEPDTENGTLSDHQNVAAENKRIGTFALLFPSIREVEIFSPVACRLQGNGYLVNVLLYGSSRYAEEPSDVPMDWEDRTIVSRGCRLNYDTLSPDDVLSPLQSISRMSFVSDWLDTLDERPEVIVALKYQDALSGLTTVLEQRQSARPSLILIPYTDLPHCEWMGSLSVKEWKNWNVPRVDISVITKDRPRSLARLLSSLSSAKFFGDPLTFRINLEQTSDIETMRLVEKFRWDHGIIVVHHRVVHGGLLPAVVESWYPHSNDSYGLLLEDDVELSPMFYAWIKMTILRYRYGDTINKSPQLFGISLYQQKNIELKLQGRRPFDARALFYDHSLPHPNTPYLSQIPCSWGAVYFPEHWREFHEYLAVRFSEYAYSIDEDVVPDVRSNRWTRSWKKYFIELVYLRGYAMLYPNYADFVSFSTNHLEVGSHVKDQPNDVYLQRKELFLLPLMSLFDNVSSSMPSSGILDLPGGTLPPWYSLPVLNLTGSLTSLQVLIDQGRVRRTQLGRCPGPPSLAYNVRDLMCINDWPSTL